jgi:preprotein translocase subunit YajC
MTISHDVVFASTWMTLAQSGQPVAPAGMPGATPTAPAATTTLPGGTIQTPVGTTGGQAQPQGSMMILMLLPLMILFMVLMSWFTGRKEKKRRAELMSSLKRGDKIQLFGGMIGTVADLYDDEVVVRVEEGRIRFARSAIQSVLSSGTKANGLIEAKDNAGKAVGV